MPHLRPLVLVGDGAFQMTGMELSTALRYGLTPLVIVLNNGGYGTERPMLDGSFNDLWPWRYHQLPEFLNGGRGFEVRSEREFVQAMAQARSHRHEYSLLNVHLDPWDISPALQRLTTALRERVVAG